MKLSFAKANFITEFIWANFYNKVKHNNLKVLNSVFNPYKNSNINLFSNMMG